MTLFTALDAPSQTWLDHHALALDTRLSASTHLLPTLATAGLTGLGVPVALGGRGGDVGDIAQAVSRVAEQSLAAAWSLSLHRCFIETLLGATNLGLRDYLLPALLEGSQAGVPPFSAGPQPEAADIAAVQAHDTGRGWRLQGRVAALGNLLPGGHLLALPVVFEPGQPAALVLLNSEQDGLHAEPLAARLPLRGAGVADLRIEQVYFREDEQLHGEAQAVLQATRPLWLILQAACALGVAQCALNALPGGAAAAPQRRLAQARRSFLDGLRLVRAFMPLGPLLRWCEYLVALAKEAVALEAAAQTGAPLQPATERRQREVAWLARRWPQHTFFET